MESLWEYRWLLAQGTGVTLTLGLCGLALSMLIGLGGAAAKIGGSPLTRRLAGYYTSFVRAVPDLCMMLLLYFGGQTLLNKLGAMTGWWDYIEINSFAAGVLTIGFIFGAYMTESFRGAYSSIPAGQFEAARAIGMTAWQMFRRITFPQLMGYALPSLGVNWMVLLKTTALVSVIGLKDLVFFGVSAGRSTRDPFTFLMAILVIYLILTAISDAVLRTLEARYTRGRRLGA
ncbi:MAG: ABC transporter permease [Aestuariivirga sp.]|uniref:ABC transporter permease n=1 Tax=Aestuariivirga sp. TaxID=2650926 RepID=UPI0038CF9D77